MNELALFAGNGGGILGGKLLGWKTVCAVEINEWCRERLMQRQDEGHLPSFPIWDDVRTFDGKPWRGLVDVISGGFPCQDISVGNASGEGLDGERSGLWSEMRRIIREVRPGFVFVENSPNLVNRGLGRILGELAALGYDAKWGVLGICDAGGNNKRLRIWIVGNLPNANESRHTRAAWQGGATTQGKPNGHIAECSWWRSAPPVQRVANGVADRIHQLRAVGNGQNPAVVRLAWRVLRGC